MVLDNLIQKETCKTQADIHASERALSIKKSYKIMPKSSNTGKEEKIYSKVNTRPHLYSWPFEVYCASHANSVQEPEENKYYKSKAAKRTPYAGKPCTR